jgi:hypothetical protein
MSTLITAANVSEAWLRALEGARGAAGGRQVHLVTAIRDPAAEIPEVRSVLDSFLAEHKEQSTDTVAETIFPSSLYQDPQFDWEPGLSSTEVAVLDAASADLYESYVDMLPMVLSVPINNRGTYFSRMITWPGKEEGGTNQLDLRIERLRSVARNNTRTNNTLDIDVAADALDPPLAGVQVYSVTDKRTRSFPCLTHIDLTLFKGTLHCTAVYRHQYLVKKAYGNLVGLSALMKFLCQQGGCELGELVVHATLGDSEGHSGTEQLITDARAALQSDVTV